MSMSENRKVQRMLDNFIRTITNHTNDVVDKLDDIKMDLDIEDENDVESVKLINRVNEKLYIIYNALLSLDKIVLHN